MDWRSMEMSKACGPERHCNVRSKVATVGTKGYIGRLPEHNHAPARSLHLVLDRLGGFDQVTVTGAQGGYASRKFGDVVQSKNWNRGRRSSGAPNSGV